MNLNEKFRKKYRSKDYLFMYLFILWTSPLRMRISRDNISEYFSVQDLKPVPLEDEEFCAVIFKGL